MDFPPQIDNFISNTPYQISSPLIFRLLSLPNPPRTITLMLQREFALRLIAQPGDSLRCRLSVNSQKWAKITHLMKVSSKNFNPPPKVESSVVRIEPKLGAEKPRISYAEWDGLLRIVFGRKNKTLRASFLGPKQVVGMLERNYRTFCSLKGVELEDGVVEQSSSLSSRSAAAQGEDVEMGQGDDDDDGEWNGVSGEEDNNDCGEYGDAAMEEDVEGDDDDTPDFFKQLAASAERSTPQTKPRKPKTRVGELVRAKIEKILHQNNMAEKRAAKLDETDFLRLLHDFNEEGIHFA